MQTKESSNRISEEKETEKSQERRSQSQRNSRHKYSKSVGSLPGLKSEKKEKGHKRSKTLENGWEATLVLKKRVGNPRYLGFSPYHSSNTLQNSSYMFSFPKNKRFTKLIKNYATTYYNVPDMKSMRYTTMGFGNRCNINTRLGVLSPSPDTYNIFSSFDYNIKHKKGAVLLDRFKIHSPDNLKNPGPGTYDLSKNFLKLNLPVTVKSRVKMFYDDDLKKRAHCVSMQRYKPKFTLTEMSRYNTINFGIGERKETPDSRSKYPGPGSYNVPGCFDRGYKKKLPIN